MRLISALPALLATAAGVGLALLVLNGDAAIAGALVIVIVIALGVLYRLGRSLLSRKPRLASLAMEASIGLEFVGAATASGALVWIAIELAPESAADATSVSARDKEIWAALSAAASTYLGTVIISPDQEWRPFKKALVAEFGTRFRDAQTPLEKDARDAVNRDDFSPQARQHRGISVAGWGWTARRRRARFVEDAL